jgi:hypothetical protein
MMRVWLSLYTFFAIILLMPLSPATAETYSWADEQSIVHFTDDPGSVPKKFRNKIRKLADDEPSEPSPADNDKDTETNNAPLQNEGVDVQATYNGKSYDHWKKELADREAAMTAVRTRIDENADAIMSSGSDWELQKRLRLEREELLSQFKELKADYFKQVEIARKAGLQINIEQ